MTITKLENYRSPHFPRSIILLLFIALVQGRFNEAAAQSAGKNPTVQFKKHIISAQFISEGVAAGDVNNDGKTDILAGNYWYEAPTWKQHLLHTDTMHIPNYSSSFLNFSQDVNNDGWIDLIRFDVPGTICVWYENPKNSTMSWNSHIILRTAGTESPAYVDVDKDGKMDIICNDIFAKKVIWLKSPAKKGDTMWQRNIISNDSVLATNRYTHGLGWGDVNKDGRRDVIIKSGWWESPLAIMEPNWKFHPANFGEDCANMFVLDADKDGDQDIISSSAHNYGIWWHEQIIDDKGTISWATHLISKLFSQSHALAMTDINGDGHPDIISGKRWLAHVKGDPGTDEPSVLYWFEFKPGKNPQWIPHEIDNNSGVGNCFFVGDINEDKLPDILISNKKGVFLFEQLK